MVKKKELTFLEKMNKLIHAGIDSSRPISSKSSIKFDDPGRLEKRIAKLLGILHDKQRKSTNMLFFVMYDIESNKVRYHIAKYLLRKGCFRIQRSIFLADLNHEQYETIRNDLAEVQSCYDNHDSILIVPISTDLLKSMKIIGKTLDLDIILQNKSTLFF